LTVGSIDLDDANRLAQQQASEPRAIGAGALDADEIELAEAAQPGEQPAVVVANDSTPTRLPVSSSAATT
jgi:hypothetical protein